MLTNGKGKVIKWSYNVNDIKNYVRNNPGTIIESQYGNWETKSESWIKVFVVVKDGG